MSQSLKDRLPYWHFDNDIMVFEDGSLGFGYKLEGFDINCTTGEKINQLSTNLEHLLTGIEEGLCIQFFYKVSSDYQEKINEHENISINAPTIYQDVTEARIEFLIWNTIITLKVKFICSSGVKTINTLNKSFGNH